MSNRKFKTEAVYEAWLLFMAFVGETEAIFPPHHKGEWSLALNCQKPSILFTQMCVATIHTEELCE